MERRRRWEWEIRSRWNIYLGHLSCFMCLFSLFLLLVFSDSGLLDLFWVLEGAMGEERKGCGGKWQGDYTEGRGEIGKGMGKKGAL